MPRRSSRAMLSTATSVMLSLTLVGCLPSDPPVTPPTTPQVEPVYANDEEALAAAEEAYDRYWRVLETIMAEGGADPERLLDVAGPEVYALEAPGFAEMREQGWRMVGEVHAELTLQQYSVSGEIVVYACEDISRTDMLDAAGDSVIAGDGATRFAYQVELAGDPLIVIEMTPWQGGGVCD